MVGQGSPSPPAVLVWTAGTGGGHRGVATAVALAARAVPGLCAGVETSEPLERAPAALRRSIGAYGPLIRHAPFAWGAVYQLTQAGPLERAVGAALDRLLVPVLRAELLRRRPRAVLVVHPLLVVPAMAARRLLPAGVPRPPIVVLVTDLAGGHRSWIHPDADRTLTASRAASTWAEQLGAPRERIAVVGLPVHPELAAPPPPPPARADLRRSLGLDPDRFCVLLSGGAEGVGPVAAAVAHLLRSDLPIQLAVICGRNHRLAARLHRWRAPLPMRVAGFVSDMPRWLRAADLVVGKAGPSSVAEAAAAGLPILVTSALPGQERPNVALVEAEGFGAALRARGLPAAVAELVRPGSERRRRMAEAARRWGRPRAAFTVAAALAELALPRDRPRTGSAPPGDGPGRR